MPEASLASQHHPANRFGLQRLPRLGAALMQRRLSFLRTTPADFLLKFASFGLLYARGLGIHSETGIETFGSQGYDGHKADIYALGLMLTFFTY